MIEDLVRSEVKKIVAYNVNEVPKDCIKLDANESPFDISNIVKHKISQFFLGNTNINIYPETNSDSLRGIIANNYKINSNQIIVGTGSDQIIQYIINTFIEKGDKVICPSPSFSMYKFYTTIAGG